MAKLPLVVLGVVKGLDFDGRSVWARPYGVDRILREAYSSHAASLSFFVPTGPSRASLSSFLVVAVERDNAVGHKGRHGESETTFSSGNLASLDWRSPGRTRDAG